MSELKSCDSKREDCSQYLFCFAGGTAFKRKTLVVAKEVLSSFGIFATIVSRVSMNVCMYEHTLYACMNIRMRQTLAFM